MKAWVKDPDAELPRCTRVSPESRTGRAPSPTSSARWRLHAARAGWDRPAQLFALVETAELLQREPQLAELLGVEAAATGPHPGRAGDRLREPRRAAVQDPVAPGGRGLCGRRRGDDGAARNETTYPPIRRPLRSTPPPIRTVRRPALWPGALRTGESFCAIRQRAHDEDDMVLAGHDLVPVLLELLHTTLEPDAGEPQTR